MTGYEYPFLCSAADGGETWRAATWTRVRQRKSVVVWRVEALEECPYCGTHHEAVTYSPVPLTTAEEEPSGS